MLFIFGKHVQTRANLDMTVKRLMFERITFNPEIMGGRACIRGMRITVSLVLSLIANGMTTKEILEAYPYLEAEDIKASIEYASKLKSQSLSNLSQY
jgi:uncharacterized protein (DUF433 family)